MVEDLDQYLIGVALGVRFRANFSIEDQLGKIVDHILYPDGAFFNPTVFPLVRSDVGRRLLMNEKTSDAMTIDNSNFILELNFGTNFQVSDLDDILDNYEDQIIKGVMKTFKIREISRNGYIRRYLFQLKDLANKFVDKTIGDTLGGIDDINLRFSKKIPIEESLVQKNINDYYNAIFNVMKRADSEEIFMSVDFQHLFDPSSLQRLNLSLNHSFRRLTDLMNGNTSLG